MENTETGLQAQGNGALSTEKKPRSLKLMIKDEEVQARFKEMLGSNAPSFLMSVLNCTQNNDALSIAEPQSVLMASAVAATLNLPIDPNLGMAYIIPFKDSKRGGATFAQFQIGYKGFIALCHRTRQFSRINVEMVYEGEIKRIDRLTGDIEFEWNQDQDARKNLKIIGCVAYFRLNNGFEKSLFMTDTELEAHGKKYSQTYKRGFGLWKDDPIGMKKKTTLKLLLEKFAPKSVEMMKAIKSDQGVINDYDAENVTYPDNDSNVIDLDELNARKEQEKKESITYLTNALNEKEELLPVEESMNIRRIIEQEEVESFAKARKYLDGIKTKK